MAASHDWDGVDRRNDQDWLQYKRKIISDIEDTKEDVEKIKEDITAIKMLMTEMKMELKQIVGKSSAITSSIVSVIVAAIGAVISFYLSK